MERDTLVRNSKGRPFHNSERQLTVKEWPLYVLICNRFQNLGTASILWLDDRSVLTGFIQIYNENDYNNTAAFTSIFKVHLYEGLSHTMYQVYGFHKCISFWGQVKVKVYLFKSNNALGKNVEGEIIYTRVLRDVKTIRTMNNSCFSNPFTLAPFTCSRVPEKTLPRVALAEETFSLFLCKIQPNVYIIVINR